MKRLDIVAYIKVRMSKNLVRMLYFAVTVLCIYGNIVLSIISNLGTCGETEFWLLDIVTKT